MGGGCDFCSGSYHPVRALVLGAVIFFNLGGLLVRRILHWIEGHGRESRLDESWKPGLGPVQGPYFFLSRKLEQRSGHMGFQVTGLYIYVL